MLPVKQMDRYIELMKHDPEKMSYSEKIKLIVDKDPTLVTRYWASQLMKLQLRINYLEQKVFPKGDEEEETLYPNLDCIFCPACGSSHVDGKTHWGNEDFDEDVIIIFCKKCNFEFSPSHDSIY